MGQVHELSVGEARRVAVRAQLLAGPRPDDPLAVVRHLGLVQADPTAAVVPSAELVCWSRLGSSYRVGDLGRLQDEGRLVELDGLLRPAEDLALHRAEMAAWTGAPGQAEWIQANDGARRDVLDKLHDEGPLTAADLPDTTVLPWLSSGWNDDRSKRMLLQLMTARGEVAVAGREGRHKLWDLAERVYPDVAVVPLDQALVRRAERRLRALGLARRRAAVTPGEPNDVGGAGEEARVAGTRGTWRVDPGLLAAVAATHDDPEPRTVLLSPLDRLIVDRRRMAELWGFDYQLEMYKPRTARRFGYWALPVLHGADLVGKVDATAERDRGVLRVDAVHEDPVPGPDGRAWPAALRDAVDVEVDALAAWLGLVVER